jgi:GNAT superfamily N-acetyltransferase
MVQVIHIGRESGAIREVVVNREFRGKEFGIAQKLFKTLSNYCRDQHINFLYLGTVDKLKAAHRFYERNGFRRISREELPVYFPTMMGENVYYYRCLL